MTLLLQFELSRNMGVSWIDTSAKRWETIPFSEGICSREVRIDVLSVYGSVNNGFIEVEFYATGG